jgi:glycosyltransferase involved in cell wall biosynthesis
MRLALIHDYLNEMGGAERVVEVLLKTFREAPLYTSVFSRRTMSQTFSEHDIRTSYMQAFAKNKSITKLFAPLLPGAFRRFDLRAYDVAISSSSGFAHHIRPLGGVHICYCYTPPRFLWQPGEYFRDRPELGRALSPLLNSLRKKDRLAAQNVDVYVGISGEVARRIAATYGRQAIVIHPPVDTAGFQISPDRSGRFLVVSRLLAYKRIDLAIEAAKRGGFGLDVIGEGPDRRRLQATAGANVRFFGWQSDEAVRRALATCEALILPGSEDFGLAVVEAQASGRPAIAFASGGALETVAEGVSGYFFDKQEWDSLAAAMARSQATTWEPQSIQTWARRFDVSVFRQKIIALIDEATAASSRRS